MSQGDSVTASVSHNPLPFFIHHIMSMAGPPPPDRTSLGEADASTLAYMSAQVVHQLFCASVRGRQIVLEYPRQIEHLLPELFQAASVSAIAYKSKST
jgi:hypothetical protein